MINKTIHRICRVLQRIKNQMVAYDFPDEKGGWKKNAHNPVLGNYSSGSMFDPFVRYVDDSFVMCVSRRKNHTLELYCSDDGICWDKIGVALSGIMNSQWESEVNRGCFLIHNETWYLWYTGQHEGKSNIGLAISNDGKNFTRIGSQPVLKPEYSFEGVAVMNPCVLWDEEKQIYRMWYAAGENYEPDVICYAESVDGIVWKKNSKPILTACEDKKYQKEKVGACDILKLSNGHFCMAYIAYENLNVARIAIAYSEDGINNWEYDENNPVLAPTKGSWDRHSVYKPTLCINPKTNNLMIWYNGRFNHQEYIGVAILEDNRIIAIKNKNDDNKLLK